MEFENVVFKYRPELEPVLKGISFKVKNGFRVGICGRTGAVNQQLQMRYLDFMNLLMVAFLSTMLI